MPLENMIAHEMKLGGMRQLMNLGTNANPYNPDRPTYAEMVTLAQTKTIKSVSGSLTADTDVITAVAGKRIKVCAYIITTGGTNANTITFKSNGTSGTELWRILLQAPSDNIAGANLATVAPAWLFATVAGEKLTIDVNQTDTVHYSISYYDDDAI